MNERELRVFRTLASELRALRQEIQAGYTNQQSGNNSIFEPLAVKITAGSQLDPAWRELRIENVSPFGENVNAGVKWSA